MSAKLGSNRRRPTQAPLYHNSVPMRAKAAESEVANLLTDADSRIRISMIASSLLSLR